MHTVRYVITRLVTNVFWVLSYPLSVDLIYASLNLARFVSNPSYAPVMAMIYVMSSDREPATLIKLLKYLKQEYKNLK
jgi:hypothetical protein